MYANALATGRNHYTAETGSLTVGDDWARVDLRWADGAHVSEVYDSKAEAVAHLNRLGFFHD